MSFRPRLSHALEESMLTGFALWKWCLATCQGLERELEQSFAAAQAAPEEELPRVRFLIDGKVVDCVCSPANSAR